MTSELPYKNMKQESSRGRTAISYMEECDSEVTNDSGTDSDATDTDRNNNDKSPTITPKFPPAAPRSSSHASNSQDFNYQRRNFSPHHDSPYISTHQRHSTEVVGAVEKYARNSFSHHLSHENANENNNSNKRSNRFQNRTRLRSYSLKNSIFRGKARSVQLSSIRAGRGLYHVSTIQPYRERLICKNGASNIRLKKLSKLDWASRYSRDMYTTLIDLSWTWVIFLTASVYIGHWVIFGLVYWLFAYLNDDWTKIMSPGPSPGLINDTSNPLQTSYGEPCVSKVYDFTSAFLFSMESETTIGYGVRTIGTECPQAITCLIVQCVISAVFDTWVIGMCFSRLARPDARCNTILYPKHAVICTRDGKRCLLIRVANLRKSLLLSVSCHAHVITIRAPRDSEESEGHQFMLEQKELNFENSNTTMLTAPAEYCHVIDEKSPLYSIPESCFISEIQNWFEVVVIVTGIVEATGMTVHAQTSYLSREIKYKHRYLPVLSVSPKRNRYIVDFAKYHDTEPEPPLVDILESARLHKESKQNQKESVEGKFGVLMEESEEEGLCDDVFERSTSFEICRTPSNHMICNCHVGDDTNVNCLCSTSIQNDNSLVTQL